MKEFIVREVKNGWIVSSRPKHLGLVADEEHVAKSIEEVGAVLAGLVNGDKPDIEDAA